MPRPGFKSYPLQMMLKQKFCHPRDRVGEIRATLPSRHRCKFVEQNLIDRIVGRVGMFPDDAGQVVTDISCLGKVDHHFLGCLYSRKEVAVSPSKDRRRPTDKRLRATSPNAAEARPVIRRMTSAEWKGFVRSPFASKSQSPTPSAIESPNMAM